MAEIIAVRPWLTVGEVGETADRAGLTNDVHPQVESHKVLGGKVDGGHLKFQKIINSNEIILWWLVVREELLFHRDRAKVGELGVQGVSVAQGGHGFGLELHLLFHFGEIFSLEGEIVEHIKVDLLLDVVDGKHLLVLIKGGAVWGGWEVWGGWHPWG